jgi:hypothetical protein
MHVKRVISVFALLLVLILSACAAPAAYVREAQMPTSPVPLICTAQGELIQTQPLEGVAEAERYLASTQDLAEYIHLALLAQESEIDLSDYRIPTDRITQVFTDVMNRYPDLFFVKSGI